MESLGAPAYKICAWDLAYLPLIERVRKTTKPILIDVGAATREEVVDAIPLTDYGEQHLFVHAPHPINGADWNLSRVSGFFQAAYPFGFSSPGRESWCDFVALGGGACLLEKRLTLRRDDPKGHHHAVSLEPDEFKAWVSQIRHAEAALREEPFENSPEAWAERQKWDRGPDGRRR
jgi:N-acetylneuraminate synthase